MNAQLNVGQYYGSVLRRTRVGSALVSETRHAANAVLPTHAHRTAYFCCVFKGNYCETIGARSRECGPLTVAFHPPEERHSERIAGQEVVSMNVEVGNDWLSHVQSNGRALHDPVDSRGGTPAWLAARIYREVRQPDVVSSLVIEGLLLELAAELSRIAQRPIDAPNWLRRIRELLCDRFRENTSLATLAREAGVHPMHLATTFRRCLGCSVGEFVRERRVDHSARLLTQQDLSLAEIAADAGFSDQSHFTRLFKRATGMTPAEYRRDAVA